MAYQVGGGRGVERTSERTPDISPENYSKGERDAMGGQLTELILWGQRAVLGTGTRTSPHYNCYDSLYINGGGITE